MHHNIPKLFLIQFIRWFILILPVIILFYQEQGFSMRYIFILMGIFSIAVLLGEIPSGYIADLYGRRKALIFGSIISFVGHLFYCFADTFIEFAFVQILLGFALSLFSGADSALLFDSLSEVDRTKDYKKSEGKLVAIHTFSESIAAVFGGWAALISLRTPIYIDTAFTLLLILACFSLKEPNRKKIDNTSGNWSAIIKVCKYSLHDNVRLKWLIAFNTSIATTTYIIVWLVQPYLKAIDIPLSWYGWAWAFLNLVVAVGSYFASHIEDLISKKILLSSLVWVTLICFCLLGFFQGIVGLFIMLIIYFARGIRTPLIRYYLNQETTSDQRATVLSVLSFVFRICFIIIGPIIGIIVDSFSLQAAFVFIGLFFSFFGFLTLRAYTQACTN